MNLAEYKEQYDHAPMELHEFADGATSINNCAALSHAAEEYLAAKQALEQALEQYDITIG